MMAVILQEPADKGAHVEAVEDEHEVADDEAGKGENDGDDEDGVDADDDDEARFSAQDLQQRFSPFFSFSCFLENNSCLGCPRIRCTKLLASCCWCKLDTRKRLDALPPFNAPDARTSQTIATHGRLTRTPMLRQFYDLPSTPFKTPPPPLSNFVASLAGKVNAHLIIGCDDVPGCLTINNREIIAMGGLHQISNFDDSEFMILAVKIFKKKYSDVPPGMDIQNAAETNRLALKADKFFDSYSIPRGKTTIIWAGRHEGLGVETAITLCKILNEKDFYPRCDMCQRYHPLRSA